MLAGFADREHRLTLRAERAGRRQSPPQDGRQSVTAEHLPDNATAGDVATWMADALERDGRRSSSATRRTSLRLQAGSGISSPI